MSNDTAASNPKMPGAARWIAALLIAMSVALLAGQAKAGQYTHDQIIGFSEDGRYFAYETFGLQRGSGLPYANIYVVDLDRDAWVSGTPFESREGEDAMAEVEAAPYAALAASRESVRQSAEPLLRDLNIRRPATVLYAAGIGQAHDASDLTRIDIPNPDDPTADPTSSFSLLLESIAVPGGPDYCYRPESLRGYRMTLQAPGAAARTLHADQRIPASRGCPTAYRLDSVVSAGYPQESSTLVAMISVWRQGFEGQQRHVISLPVTMP